MQHLHIRLAGVLKVLGVTATGWCRRLAVADQRLWPIPPPLSMPHAVEQAMLAMAADNP